MHKDRKGCNDLDIRKRDREQRTKYGGGNGGNGKDTSWKAKANLEKNSVTRQKCWK